MLRMAKPLEMAVRMRSKSFFPNASATVLRTPVADAEISEVGHGKQLS